MKKKLFFISICVLLTFTFSISIFAAVPPLYESNSQGIYENGNWSPATLVVFGSYRLVGRQHDGVNIYDRTFPANTSLYPIIFDGRDQYGDGEVYYRGTFPADRAFIYYNNYYDGIRITLYDVDGSGEAVVDKIELSTASDGDWFVIYERYNDFTSTEYIQGNGLFVFSDSSSDTGVIFGASTMPLDDRSQLYVDLFGMPVMDGEQLYAGMFRPIDYSSGDVPDVDPDDPNSAESFLGPFMMLLFNCFERILGISFFGGFFSIGTVFGAVIGFALIRLFLKYFAGG